MFDHIRQLFAKVPESRTRGFTPRTFSFNVPGGRCEACEGLGQRRVEMHFLPDVWVECEACKGRRYSSETLHAKWHGKSIADVLEMSVADAAAFFETAPHIARILNTLVDVGLGYITLGQPAPQLSGGEAQRVKLSRELAKPGTGQTLYILDEPTTGLHFADIEKLLHVLERLVDAGNTVLVVEHNLEVISAADWVLDMGPEAGAGGGRVVAEGPPEDIVIHARQERKDPASGLVRSHTGEALDAFGLMTEAPRPTAGETPSTTAPRGRSSRRGSTPRHRGNRHLRPHSSTPCTRSARRDVASPRSLCSKDGFARIRTILLDGSTPLGSLSKSVRNSLRYCTTGSTCADSRTVGCIVKSSSACVPSWSVRTWRPR